MKTRTLICVMIIVFAVVSLFVGPLLTDEKYVIESGFYETEWSYEIFIFYVAALLGIASVIYAIVSDYKDNDSRFVLALFVGGLIFTLGSLIMDIGFTSEKETWLHLLYICGIASIGGAIASKSSELKVSLTVSSAGIVLVAIFLLPVFTGKIYSPGGSFNITVDNYTIVDLLSYFETISTIAILFVILVFAGLLVAIVNLVSFVFGKDENYDTGVISSGILLLAAVLLFLVNVNFERAALNSVIYLILLCGTTNLITGLLARKERI